MFRLQVTDEDGDVIAEAAWTTKRTTGKLREAHTVRLPPVAAGPNLDGLDSALDNLAIARSEPSEPERPHDSDHEEPHSDDELSLTLSGHRPEHLRSPMSGGPFNDNMVKRQMELMEKGCLCPEKHDLLCPHAAVDLAYMERPSPPPSPGHKMWDE